MSLGLADITQIRQEFEKTIKQLDMQIQTLETAYLQQTKQTGNIIRGFDNYSAAKINPRSALNTRGQKIDLKERLFTLSSVKASSGYKIEEIIEVKVEATIPPTSRNPRRKKKRPFVNKNVQDSGQEDGDSIGNSQGTYEDYDTKGKRRS